jgi:hypothetical protein
MASDLDLTKGQRNFFQLFVAHVETHAGEPLSPQLVQALGQTLKADGMMKTLRVKRPEHTRVKRGLTAWNVVVMELNTMLSSGKLSIDSRSLLPCASIYWHEYVLPNFTLHQSWIDYTEHVRRMNDKGDCEDASAPAYVDTGAYDSKPSPLPPASDPMYTHIWKKHRQAQQAQRARKMAIKEGEEATHASSTHASSTHASSTHAPSTHAPSTHAPSTKAKRPKKDEDDEEGGDDSDSGGGSDQ